MSQEYAALLAQVIPVMAIAIGLEIRALAPRIEAAMTVAIKPEDGLPDISVSRSIALWATAVIITCLTFTQVFLAALESSALKRVAGASDYFELPIHIALFVTFMAPSIEVLVRSVTVPQPYIPLPRWWAWSSAVVTVLMLVFVYNLVFGFMGG